MYTTVIINRTPFKVVLADENIEKLNPGNDVQYLGLTEYTPWPTITFRKGMCPANMRNTVIHELVHAYVFACGHSMNCEEDMCQFIGAQIDNIMETAEQILAYLDSAEHGSERE